MSTAIIQQPVEQRAKLLLWQDLTLAEVQTLNSLHLIDDIRAFFIRTYFSNNNSKIEDSENDNNILISKKIKSEIIADLFFYAYQFCLDQKFTEEQISVFIGFINQIHKMAISTPFGNVDQVFKYFKNLLKCHSVHRPPFSLEIFKVNHCASITNYVIDTYFRHFKMYKYAFTPQVSLDLNIGYEGIPPEEITNLDDTKILQKETSNLSNVSDKKEAKEEDAKSLQKKEPEIKVEESQIIKDLKTLIRLHLTEEIKRIKKSINERLTTTEEGITKKLTDAEGRSLTISAGNTANTSSGKKSGRASAKKK